MAVVALVFLLAAVNILIIGPSSRSTMATLQQHPICGMFNGSYPKVRNSSDIASYTLSQNLSTTLPAYSDGAPAKLRVVAVQNKKVFTRPMCELTIFSAAVNAIPLEVYGAAPYFDFMMPGKNGKVDRMLSVLCAIDPTEAVLMVDAYDVIFQRSFEEIQFQYIHKWKAPNLVVSTESNCWPKAPEHCKDEFVLPTPPSGVKYINSGVIIGKTDAWIQMLSDAIDMFHNGTKDDQYIITELINKHHKTRGYFLDSNSELSASPQPPAPSFGKFAVNNRTYFVSSSTKTVPMIVHLNGGGKDLIFPRDMWYMDGGKVSTAARDIIKNYRIFVDGREVAVKEVCPRPEFE
ncbi:hypothetical protein HDU83_008873 [Entophlyctis luteolus]|nr:hypothetical protein HDU83_008873 [Entophlyctis luteolus]KAJ3390464.1 hypothetical protein HDU84_007465 [Entophlyctis sp. JEL0112]